MPLQNKYLKYTPEITEGIFKLIWDKLHECGWKCYNNQDKKTIYDYLTKKKWIGIKQDKPNVFIQYKDNIVTNLQETTVEKILGYNPFKKEFVVGKWYKKDKYILKLLEYKSSEQLWAKEWIVDGEYEVDNHSSWVHSNIYVKEVSLQEIQQYLPEGHVDKISPNLKVEDLIEGEVYYCKGIDYHYIFHNTSKKYIAIHGEFIGSGFCRIEDYIYTLATLEEKHWLNKCISLNKYISKEEALKDFGLKEVLLPPDRDWTKASKEELLEEAKRRYKPGMTIDKFPGNGSEPCVITTFSRIHFDVGAKDVRLIGGFNYNTALCVYKDGKWAEIIQEEKDDFVLPKYWHVIVTKENLGILSKWRFDNNRLKLDVGDFVGISSFRDTKAHNSIYLESFGQEITFEQFQKYVLKTPIKEEVKPIEKPMQEIIPEYVECIKSTSNKSFILGNIYKTNSSSEKHLYRFDKDEQGDKNGLTATSFKPSTKEAYEAQNKPIKQYVGKVVHCTTQEEWDFVSNKLEYIWFNSYQFNLYKNNSCIKLSANTCGNLNWYKDNNYQILSFQEWCEENSYFYPNKPKDFGKYFIGTDPFDKNPCNEVVSTHNPLATNDYTWKILESQKEKPKLILSIDEEELPMVSIKPVKQVKTFSIN